jgi:hypothetical protein
MTQRTKRLLYWLPRVLGILFAVFISIFALDVFGVGYSFWETVWALLMHLVPTGIVVLILVLAWHWAWVGAVLFPLLGVLYIAVFWEPSNWPAYLLLSGPLVLIGILFWLNWHYRTELQPR